MLYNVRGAKAVTIVARTKPKLSGGKKCPYAGVEKISTVNGMINFNYENSVNNQREREGNEEVFESAPRQWGKRLYETPEEVENPNSSQRIDRKRKNPRHLPFVAKNWEDDTITEEEFNQIPDEELYLEMKVQGSAGYIYMMNGVEQDKDLVNAYLPKSSDSGRQEVEKPIILRDFKFEGVEDITLNGEFYKVA